MAPAPETVTAYIALGANLGDRGRNLRDALSRLNATPRVRVARVSSFHDNPAVGGPPDGPPFLNAAAGVETTLDPRALLCRLLDIERAMGRERREKWGPRPIDLDLIFYANHIIHDPGLTVPHPLMHRRRFVLEPLGEIAPDAIHPVLRLTVAELTRRLALDRSI